MRERFTEQLRAAVDHAQRIARDLNQEYVGTEHLLLGTLRCEECEAARALKRDEVDLQELRDAILKVLPRGDEAVNVTGDLPFSPKAKEAVTAALMMTGAGAGSAASLNDGSNGRVSTRLALLALMQEPDTVIREALRHCGADVDQLQRMLSDPPAEPEN